jgi:hypothetical protein
MQPDFMVDPPALETFADTSVSRGQAFDGLRDQVRGMELPRDAFGYVPGVGGRVYDAYDEFTRNVADSLTSCAETMMSISSAVRGVVLAYESADDAPREIYSIVESELGSADIQGVS